MIQFPIARDILSVVRRASIGGRALVLVSLLAVVACSDDPPACQGAQCSPPNPGAPTFAGVASVAPDRTGDRARVTWLPAQDDKTRADQIRYRVYLSTRSGVALSRRPVATSEPGATSLYVAIAPVGVPHYVVVRAIDEDNYEDGNAVEKSFLATGDTAPPTFGGLKSTRPEPGAGATLTWDPATDDRTSAEGMRYAVLDAANPSAAPLHVVEGKTEVTLASLGAPGGKRSLLVRALDAADNSDGNTKVVEATLGGEDGGPGAPVFAGCSAVDGIGSRVLRVSWPEATDDGTPHAKMTYEVFAATSSTTQTFATPGAKIVGQTSLLLFGLTASTTYYVVCRARDASGQTEQNTNEKSAITTANVTPPNFAGGVAALGASTREATINWTAATDDTTTADKIVYVVYEAHNGMPFDFTTPRAVTPPGATSIQLKDLPSRTTLRFVVRARDADYNEDQNFLESGGATNTSFSLDVIPLFAQHCAVVGCHIAPISVGGMSLSAFNAYQQTVDVPAGQRPLLKRVSPNDSANSYLYQKTIGAPGIAGNPMPAPGTGNILSPNDEDILRTWIDQGAIKN
jgi:hypothetical protein